MNAPGRGWPSVILLAVLAGCGRTPAPPEGTGAREVVRDYYEGLVLRDWRRAYAALHPDIRKRWSPDEFTRLALVQRRGLAFEPDAVVVQSCEEKGTEAVAHVVWKGGASSRRRRFKDGIALRRSAGGWRVVLPSSFGRKSR